jgi:hypothetical protein
MTVRTLTLAVAVGLLLAAGHTTAQVPSAPSDAEQRLKTLEDKMDRVLKLLEARESPRPGVPAATAAVREARDKVAALLREREQAVREPGQKIGERLAKLESHRLTLMLKKTELSAHLFQVEKAYREGGNKAAMTVIRSLSIQLNKGAKPADADDPKPFIDMLKTMVVDADKQIGALNAAFNDESRVAREQSVRDVQSEPELTRLRQMLDGLDAILRAEK